MSAYLGLDQLQLVSCYPASERWVTQGRAWDTELLGLDSSGCTYKSSRVSVPRGLH